MIKLTLTEFLTRGFLEAFLIILIIHGVCSKKIEAKKYILSSILLNISTFLIRMLPINFGVHTVLNLICLIAICTTIFKINMFEATKGCLIVTLILFITEAINVLVLQAVYGEKFLEIINTPIDKVITSLPSTIIFGIIGFIWYKVSINKLKVRG